MFFFVQSNSRLLNALQDILKLGPNVIMHRSVVMSKKQIWFQWSDLDFSAKMEKIIYLFFLTKFLKKVTWMCTFRTSKRYLEWLNFCLMKTLVFLKGVDWNLCRCEMECISVSRTIIACAVTSATTNFIWKFVSWKIRNVKETS